MLHIIGLLLWVSYLEHVVLLALCHSVSLSSCVALSVLVARRFIPCHFASPFSPLSRRSLPCAPLLVQYNMSFRFEIFREHLICSCFEYMFWAIVFCSGDRKREIVLWADRCTQLCPALPCPVSLCPALDRPATLPRPLGLPSVALLCPVPHRLVLGMCEFWMRQIIQTYTLFQPVCMYSVQIIKSSLNWIYHFLPHSPESLRIFSVFLLLLLLLWLLLLLQYYYFYENTQYYYWQYY